MASLNSGILNQVSEWVDFLRISIFSFYAIPETSMVGIFHWCCGLGSLSWLFCVCSATEREGWGVDGAREESKFCSSE